MGLLAPSPGIQPIYLPPSLLNKEPRGSTQMNRKPMDTRSPPEAMSGDCATTILVKLEYVGRFPLTTVPPAVSWNKTRSELSLTPSVLDES